MPMGPGRRRRDESFTFRSERLALASDRSGVRGCRASPYALDRGGGMLTFIYALRYSARRFRQVGEGSRNPVPEYCLTMFTKSEPKDPGRWGDFRARSGAVEARAHR